MALPCAFWRIVRQNAQQVLPFGNRKNGLDKVCLDRIIGASSRRNAGKCDLVDGVQGAAYNETEKGIRRTKNEKKTDVGREI